MRKPIKGGEVRAYVHYSSRHEMERIYSTIYSLSAKKMIVCVSSGTPMIILQHRKKFIAIPPEDFDALMNRKSDIDIYFKSGILPPTSDDFLVIDLRFENSHHKYFSIRKRMTLLEDYLQLDDLMVSITLTKREWKTLNSIKEKIIENVNILKLICDIENE